MNMLTLRDRPKDRDRDRSSEAAVPRFERAIYLDHHATTPVDERVAALVLDAMVNTYGNPASVDHHIGDVAALAVADARRAVAGLVGAEADDVRFTSGSTEAIRVAMAMAKAEVGDRPLRIVVSRAEHKAVIEAAAALERVGAATIRWLGVDGVGDVNLSEVADTLEAGADLLCLMAANNEVGTIYPVEQVARLASSFGAAILVDATQAAGRIDINATGWNLDYLVLSAHKLYGPKGVGALVARDANRISVETLGGHEGTQNVPGAVGMGEACRLRMIERPMDEARITELRDRLQAALLAEVPDIVVNGSIVNRLSNNLHISVLGADNGAVTARLHRTVAISTGAACSSGSEAPSHVLRAMGLADALQHSALRISPGKFTTSDEIDRAAVMIAAAVQQVRAMGGGR